MPSVAVVTAVADFMVAVVGSAEAVAVSEAAPSADSAAAAARSPVAHAPLEVAVLERVGLVADRFEATLAQDARLVARPFEAVDLVARPVTVGLREAIAVLHLPAAGILEAVGDDFRLLLAQWLTVSGIRLQEAVELQDFRVPEDSQQAQPVEFATPALP